MLKKVAESELQAFLGERTSWAHFIYAAVDLANIAFGQTWPSIAQFADYQTIERLFLWRAEPNLFFFVLQPVGQTHWKLVGSFFKKSCVYLSHSVSLYIACCPFWDRNTM